MAPRTPQEVFVQGGYALGAGLGPGSYVHIPSGLEHDIDVSTTGGCTILYL